MRAEASAVLVNFVYVYVYCTTAAAHSLVRDLTLNEKNITLNECVFSNLQIRTQCMQIKLDPKTGPNISEIFLSTDPPVRRRRRQKREGVPLPSRVRGLGSVVNCPEGSGAEPRSKTV